MLLVLLVSCRNGRSRARALSLSSWPSLPLSSPSLSLRLPPRVSSAAPLPPAHQTLQARLSSNPATRSTVPAQPASLQPPSSRGRTTHARGSPLLPSSPVGSPLSALPALVQVVALPPGPPTPLPRELLTRPSTTPRVAPAQLPLSSRRPTPPTADQPSDPLPRSSPDHPAHLPCASIHSPNTACPLADRSLRSPHAPLPSPGPRAFARPRPAPSPLPPP